MRNLIWHVCLRWFSAFSPVWVSYSSENGPSYYGSFSESGVFFYSLFRWCFIQTSLFWTLREDLWPSDLKSQLSFWCHAWSPWISIGIDIFTVSRPHSCSLDYHESPERLSTIGKLFQTRWNTEFRNSHGRWCFEWFGRGIRLRFGMVVTKCFHWQNSIY